MPMMPEGAEHAIDGVPLYSSQGARRQNQAYDWSLTRSRYLYEGERQPPSGGICVSKFPHADSSSLRLTSSNMQTNATFFS